MTLALKSFALIRGTRFGNLTSKRGNLQYYKGKKCFLDAKFETLRQGEEQTKVVNIPSVEGTLWKGRS